MLSDSRVFGTLTLENGSEDSNMACLVGGDLLQVLVEVLSGEPGLGKVVLGEVLETLGVEGGLEVLKGQGIVQDGPG